MVRTIELAIWSPIIYINYDIVMMTMVEALQATQVKNPEIELLEKLAQEHLETLKLLAKNGNHKTD